MLYPIKFKPIFKHKPWGGSYLYTYFKKNIPKGKIGESWELCCRDDGISVVTDGSLKGRTLLDLIGTFKEKLLGTRIYEKYKSNFPLFFKILDANKRLSVQVHPDDRQAEYSGLTNGKDEMWYVIDAKENARIIYGLKNGTSKKRLIEAIKNNRVIQLLNEVTVKPGYFIYIPAGTVHALMDGILVAEIQQNSNTTYRIYDWDRKDQNGHKRELQIPQALNAIHYIDTRPMVPFPAPIKQIDQAKVRSGPNVKGFQVDELLLNNIFPRQSDPESFQVLMDLKGEGKILFDSGCVELNKGDTILIPAGLGNYCLLGCLNLLYIHISKKYFLDERN